MIGQTAKASQTRLDLDVGTSPLDDPFAGLLGRTLPQDELWLARPVPRYTSYPPATAFQDDFTAESYESALSALWPEELVSLYLHVPFCRALCLYCGCNTVPTRQHERIGSYLDSLHREIERVALTSSRARRVGRIHFGGGSPNIMSEKDMGLMFGALARRFDLSACREIAMELDPRLVTKAQARTLGMTGVSRVSLGVQDFTPDVQEAIGRIQPFDEVKEACDMMRQHGVKQINFDLMYGLPAQTPVTIAESTRLAVSLKPERVSLFSYAHIPQVKKHQKALEAFILPGPYACLALERAARAVLRDAGYVEIGMDHFALPEDPLAKAQAAKRLHRNFQGYTDDPAPVLLGLGASSIGKLGPGFFQNARGIEEYQEKIARNGFATSRGLRLSGEDRIRAMIIEELMCHMSVNLEHVCRTQHYSLSAFSAEMEALKPYQEAGIITVSGYKIELAIPHRMAIRVIAAIFDNTPRASATSVSRVV